MGVWYIVKGKMDDGFNIFNTSCIVYAVTVKEASNKAINHLCTDSDCHFDIISVHRLDKDKIYCVK